MHKCFRFSGANRLVELLIVLGTAAAVFSVLVMLGTAASQEKVNQSFNRYSCLVINPNNEDIDIVYNVLGDFSDSEIENVICISRGEDKSFVLGWNGFSNTRWFPHSSGRFFSQEEQENGLNVAYVSGSVVKKKGSKSQCIVGEEEYAIIGTGEMIPWNFQCVVPETSSVQLMEIGEGELSEDYSFYILPFLTYERKFKPEQIIVHFQNVTENDLIEVQHIFQKYLRNAEILLPRFSMSDSNNEIYKRYMQLAAMVSGIAVITIVQLIDEWIRNNSKMRKVYSLCGMSLRKICIKMMERVTLLYLVGAGLGYTFFRMVLPVLSMLYELSVPRITKYVPILCVILVCILVEIFTNVMDIRIPEGWSRT